MRPEIWSAQLARAREVLHPEPLEVIEKFQQPFVSLISSVEYPNAAYFNGKLFFVGDALVLMQPNTAQGTNHAAMEAMLLAKVFDGTISVEEWEKQVQENAHVERPRSRDFARQWLE
jgi:2-polyprenyl-6-methoxyphenol hydroxylase-like FAD-dependent oxidoreductase